MIRKREASTREIETGQRYGGKGPGEYDASRAKKEKCFRKGVINDIKIC